MTRSVVLKLSMAFFMAATAVVSDAADKSVEDLLAQMRGAYKAIQGATFTCESHFPGATFVNDYTYESPSKIRLEISDPKGSTYQEKLIKTTDGKSIAFKLPNQKTFAKQPFSLDTFENNLPANLESFCFFDFQRQLSTAQGKNMEHSKFRLMKGQKWNGKSWTVLEETATAQKIVCSYYIDPKSHLIWRVLQKQLGKPEAEGAEFIVKKMNPKAKIDESAFGAS